MTNQIPREEPGKVGTVLPVLHLKKIMVPVDFSDCSKRALEYAIPFARQFGAHLTLLHVVEPLVAIPNGEVVSEEILMSTDDARKGLEELRKSFIGDIPCKSLVREGSPQIEITEAAKELGTDLIILSTHGRTGLEHVLMGSTAEKVVRRASCPVLIVREHEHEFIHLADADNGGETNG